MVEKYSAGEYVITYNGQIYNTKELKEELQEVGFSFSTHSDTEVLLKAYIHYGKNVVNLLNGTRKQVSFFSKRTFWRKAFVLKKKKKRINLCI